LCQNVEAQALLTALKQEWSAECEVLIKERETTITKKYQDEIVSYRAEVCCWYIDTGINSFQSINVPENRNSNKPRTLSL